jgi:hypothetical protein
MTDIGPSALDPELKKGAADLRLRLVARGEHA